MPRIAHREYAIMLDGKFAANIDDVAGKNSLGKAVTMAREIARANASSVVSVDHIIRYADDRGEVYRCSHGGNLAFGNCDVKVAGLK